MSDERRCMSLIKESEGLYVDFSRQRVTAETIKVFFVLVSNDDFVFSIEGCPSSHVLSVAACKSC
jgi:hypothetical protein